MQAGLLQAEINGIGAIQRAEAALGEAAKWPTGRLGVEGNSQLERLLAAFLEDTKDIAGLAEGKTRERFEKFEDSARASLFRCWCVGITQLSGAAGAVGLTEVRIFLWVTAVIVERRTPEHGAVIHHAELDMINGLSVAKTASAVCDAEVTRVDKLNEFVTLLVEKNAGIVRICRAFPEDVMTGRDVRFVLSQTRRGIDSMAVGAAEHNVR